MAENGNGNDQAKSSPWDERPLDPGERAVFRRMRRDWEWYNTVFSLLRRVSTWSLGVAGAIWAGREVIGKLLKALAP